MILTHFRQIAFPQSASEILWNALDFANSKDLFEGFIDRGRIGLYAEFAGSLFQELFIKHKICASHVYILAEHQDTPEPILHPNFSGGRDEWLKCPADRCLHVLATENLNDALRRACGHLTA